MSVVLFFTICLPLDHVCLEAGLMTGHDLSAQGFSLGQQVPAPAQKDDVCAACLWSHNVLSSRMTVGLAVARVVTSAPICLAAPALSLPDYFQSTAKRGPPSLSII